MTRALIIKTKRDKINNNNQQIKIQKIEEIIHDEMSYNSNSNNNNSNTCQK